ncbi:MAG: hypothetical protein LBG16_03110 [Elusimicrobiota bacterium]|nr:hypothetical protein [Elusimicrobiota bacterium]
MIRQKILILLTAAVLFAVPAKAGEVDALANKLAEKRVIAYGEAARIISESDEKTRTLNALPAVEGTASEPECA